MKRLIFNLIILLTVVISAKGQTWYSGLILREDLNIFKIPNMPDKQISGLELQPGIGIGTHFSKRNKLIGWSAELFLTRASYKLNYSSGGNIFEKAELWLLNSQGQIEYFPKNKNLFTFGGIQLSTRRYGKEYFIDGVVPNSIWPKNRAFFQMGLGNDFKINNIGQLRFLTGLRFNPNDNFLLYDKLINQIYASAVFRFKISGFRKIKSKTSECYSF
jgi:hypothetical protein